MKILLASSSFHGGGITSYALELITCYSVVHEFYLMIGETNGYINEKTFTNIISENMNDLSAANAKKVTNTINELNPDVLIISFARVVGLIVPYLNDNIRIISISHSLRYDESDIAAFQAPYIDKIIALSHYNMTYLKDKFKIADEKKIQVVYNFIKPIKALPPIAKKEASTHEPIIVFAGGGAPSKAPELVHAILLKLLKTPTKFRFYWLGDTHPPLKRVQKLKKIEHIVPDDCRVIFTGKIPRNKATSILSQANIILIPSRREGCPMVLLEAMSAGVIVLTSDYENSCREIVEDAKCGKVIPHNDINKFVNTILDISNKPSMYEHCYEAAMNYFEEKLSFEAWKNEMDKLIHETEKQHSPRLSFSNIGYVNILSRWKRCSRFNAIHMLLIETLPSALSFFCRNIYCKHYKHNIYNR
ncbi:MAG: glycosyltransferase family 4 protein [Bacteroidaceae bacterium]|nr:glycosyltransferase family 4 protein [Bacteroidaceae bacterium]